MTDEQARKAQNAILRIRSTLTDATLSEIETTAAIDGWLHLVKAEIERRRQQMQRRRR